jgi:hypothetical protein
MKELIGKKVILKQGAKEKILKNQLRDIQDNFPDIDEKEATIIGFTTNDEYILEFQFNEYSPFTVNCPKELVFNIEDQDKLSEKIRKVYLDDKLINKKDKVDFTTQEKIDILFNNFRDFLKEKNRRYGDSALHPMQVFSKIDTGNQLCNRLDDKLNRIKNGEILRKNDIADMFGYLGLLMIQKDWLDFKDLLD